MHYEIVQYNRQELYEQVWSVPMSKLSERLGLSDVGLAKICKKYNIPRPPRGYWAKKKVGQEPKRTPLPPGDLDVPIEIRLNPYNISNSNLKTSTMAKVVSKKEPEKRMFVSETLRNPHPLVKQSAEILKSLEPNSLGILEPPKRKCLDIEVTKKSLRRALLIMDTLIKYLEERGYQVFISDESSKVNILEVPIRFGISEELMTVRKEPKDHRLDGYYQFGHSRFYSERVPSGNLCLTIHDAGRLWGANYRQNWRDTKTKRLENLLDSFINGLIKVAVANK